MAKTHNKPKSKTLKRQKTIKHTQQKNTIKIDEWKDTWELCEFFFYGILLLMRNTQKTQNSDKKNKKIKQNKMFGHTFMQRAE